MYFVPFCCLTLSHSADAHLHFSFSTRPSSLRPHALSLRDAPPTCRLARRHGARRGTARRRGRRQGPRGEDLAAVDRKSTRLLQSLTNLVCRLLLEKKKKKKHKKLK